MDTLFSAGVLLYLRFAVALPSVAIPEPLAVLFCIPVALLLAWRIAQDALAASEQLLCTFVDSFGRMRGPSLLRGSTFGFLIPSAAHVLMDAGGRVLTSSWGGTVFGISKRVVGKAVKNLGWEENSTVFFWGGHQFNESLNFNFPQRFHLSANLSGIWLKGPTQHWLPLLRHNVHFAQRCFLFVAGV